MTINQKRCPFELRKKFAEILEEEISNADPPKGQALTISFRDPDYSYERGGFHPVEIRINGDGEIAYITDFAFVGSPPFVELVKEIDFDFSMGLFQHFVGSTPSSWEKNSLSSGKRILSPTLKWGPTRYLSMWMAAKVANSLTLFEVVLPSQL